jgi:AP-4 complex subunit beta-1
VADLLGFDGPPVAAAVAAPAAVPAPALAAGVTMTGEEYQSIWGSIPDADSIVETVLLSGTPPSTDIVEQALATVHVHTMASGELPGEFKFFLYAQDATSGSMLLVQSNISKGGEPLMILTVKVSGNGTAADQGKVDHLTKIIQGVLA